MTDDHAGSNPLCFLPTRLRVGVSGHRQAPKLPDAALGHIRANVDRILAGLAEAARQQAEAAAQAAHRLQRPRSTGDETARCAVITSLAEGADRIAAEAGLAAGFALEAILPFDRAEYAKDFVTTGSQAKFHELLDGAASVMTLEGDCDDRPRAYETAGLVMLANIDLLIAIWDGNDADGLGGTGEIVCRALADGVPVAWIDPDHPEILRLSAGHQKAGVAAVSGAGAKEGFRQIEATELARTFADILFPPLAAEERAAMETYLGERERRWNACPWFPLLLLAFAKRPLRWRDFRLPAFLADSRAQWAHYFASLPADKAQRPAIESVLLPAYSMANHLSVYYSLIYRSTYVFNFMFAAVAVALALSGIFIHDPQTKSYFVLAELLVIASILLTWLYGHRRQWHRRWLDYRRLAEYIRQMRILAPLGSGRPINRPSQRFAVDEQDWVNWYALLLRRALPLPYCSVDTAYRKVVCETVRATEIAEQLRYHQSNHRLMANLDHRIHATGRWLFSITAALCLLFLCFIWIAGLPEEHHPYTHHILGVFTLVTALLPTFGAALTAIHFQGEFKTVSLQSQRTAARLAELDEALAQEVPSFARLVGDIETLSDVMVADLHEWQTVFRTRPLALPA